jgi:hypothetical protein
MILTTTSSLDLGTDFGMPIKIYDNKFEWLHKIKPAPLLLREVTINIIYVID